MVLFIHADIHAHITKTAAFNDDDNRPNILRSTVGRSAATRTGARGHRAARKETRAHLVVVRRYKFTASSRLRLEDIDTKVQQKGVASNTVAVLARSIGTLAGWGGIYNKTTVPALRYPTYTSRRRRDGHNSRSPTGGAAPNGEPAGCKLRPSGPATPPRSS